MTDLNSLEQQYNLPTGWLSAIQSTENSGSNAVSPKGAVGRFQLMPETARAYGVTDSTDDDQAAAGAARMSADLAKQYNGDPVRMAAAYNWGSGNLHRRGLDNAPAETKSYIKSILSKMGDALISPAEAAGADQEPSVQEGQPTGRDLSAELFADGKPDAVGAGDLVAAAGRDLSGELFGAESKVTSGAGDLPTGASAVLPETEKAATDSLDLAGSGAQDIARAVSPAVSLYKMATGKPLSADERNYLDQSTAAGVLSPVADVGKGLAKGALGALGTLFSPMSGANRAFVANPVQNATGVPAGITDAAMSLVEPAAVSKLAEVGKLFGGASKAAPDALSALSRYAGLLKDAPAAAASDVGTAPLDVAKAAAGQVGGDRAVQPASNAVALPKTAGAVTQDPTLQRFEADAFAGAKGDAAQKAATDYRVRLNDATGQSIQKLGSAVPDGNPTDSMNDAFNLVHANEEQANNAVQTAYKTAHDLADGIAIDPKDMATNLVPTLVSTADKVVNTEGATPAALGQYKKLMNIVGGTGGDNTVAPLTLPVLLNKGEGWRTATSMFMRNTTNPADKNALGRLLGTYDNYMSGLADRLGATGPSKSSEAINAFKEAIATRRDYAQRFESNDLVQDVLGSRKDSLFDANGKSSDDLTSQFLGSGAVGGKSGMADNFNSLMRASGDEAPIVRQHIQNAIAQKIYNGATQGTGLLPGGEVASISPAKLATQLENVFVKQRDLATSVFGADTTAGAEDTIKQLKQITSKQPNVGNAPSSGYTVERLAKASGVMKQIPLLKWIPQAFEAYKNAGYAKDAAQTFAGKIPLPPNPRPVQAGAALVTRNSIQNGDSQ